jgi:hypothetical protein
MVDNISVVYDIFSESSWENIYQFEKDIRRITDKKFLLGLLMEFVRADFNYDVDKEYISELMFSIDDNIDNHFEASDYYIDSIRKDVRTIMNDFLYNQEGDLSENQEMITWIKSLSKDEIEILESYYVSSEMYEVIVFIMEIHNEKES